jgi:uncharacterized membrane protein
LSDHWGTARTEAFSDGVFAFAITLLVLDIGVSKSKFHDLLGGLTHQWPQYVGYATSFLTVGGIWLVHHGMFRRFQSVNRRLMTINLLLLMAVAFLPFPTRLMAEAISTTSAERTAVIFYGVWLLVIQLLISALWLSATRDRELLMPEVSEKEAKAIMLAVTPSIGFYVCVIVLGLLAPKVAAFGYLLLSAFALVRARGDRTPPPITAPE